MQPEQYEHETLVEDLDAEESGNSSRRRLIGAAMSSFVAGATGLLIPGWLEETAAQEDGSLNLRNGRRNKNRRRHQRRQHDRKNENQKEQDKPRGACINVYDMTVIFKNLTASDHLMSVSHGGGGCNFVMKYRWINKVVPKFQEYQFVGWYPDMFLDLYSVSPYLRFEARNPGLGFPSMKVTKGDSSAPGGRRTILDQGFFVDEVAHIDGFEIKRQPDSDEHKVFVITTKL